jgi:two-component system, LuxR family, response regulator FixJ
MSDRQVHVIDDEDAIRRSMQLMLRVMGYAPQTFESGVGFLAAQPGLAPACVLLDLRMPEIDGLELQRRLNALGSEHSIIVMSGHGDLGIAVTAMEQGAIAFLEKPFSRATLQEVLELAFARIEDPDTYRAYLRSAAAAVQKLEAVDQKVLELMAHGHDSDSIAEQTGMPAVSIEVSRSRIYAELGVQTVTEVLRLAFAARHAAPH